MRSSVQIAPNKYLENISRMFKKLYQDEQLVDVTLCCKDGTIKAHKVILAASSPYFHKIFTESNKDHTVLVMYGISYQNLRHMVELMYKGNVDVQPEALNPLYELAGEFQLSGISGVLREGNEKSENESMTPSDSFGRDTRFRGQKRVAVDYRDTDSNAESGGSSPKKFLENPPQEELRSSLGISKGVIPSPAHNQTEIKVEIDCSSEPIEPIIREDSPKLSAWAKKLRKFKCDLCPSSFKRSSHLSRHQLVHTGERPFACDQCDKAFSRHDKLKHHIKKSHEAGSEGDFSMEVDLSQHMTQHMTPERSSPLPFVIASVETAAPPAPDPPKRGRGRPRKHPVVSQVRSEVDPDQPKRPRGRPRKYPPIEKPLVKRGRGRPRLNPVKSDDVNGENYDITNLPYGDLDYLTMPLQEPAMIEPYVEIKTGEEGKKNKEGVKEEKEVKEEEEEEEEVAENSTIRDLENRIAKIGECTITVASHST